MDATDLMDDLPLAAEFPAATREAWDEAVARVLKGADFAKTLVGRTHDGIRIEPIYPKAEPPAGLAAARGAGPWRIVARVDHPDPATANDLLLTELDGGADALAIVLPGGQSSRGFGLGTDGVESWDRALSGIFLDLVSVRIEGGLDGIGAIAQFTGLAERRGHRLGDLDLHLGLDPIGAGARSGRLPPAAASGETLAATLTDLAARGFVGRLALADGRPYHEAGAGEAQELAAVLATALAYLRALEAGGHDLDRARDAISFLLVGDADEFLTVAKFRAIRRLWAAVEQGCGLAPKPIHLAAETAWRSMTRRDPWTNLLRGTLAGFSAGIGGADAVGILPFTAALGLPDAFARRLARNTQLLLIEESNLARVADPVAGAGAFEALTDALVDQAWALFAAIEREGGIAAALASGTLPDAIAETRRGRETAVATRREPLIGSSAFPDLREAAVAVLLPSRPADAMETRLPSLRLSEPFERLRDRSDAILAASGARPRVFLATLGPLAAYSARATFASNAFAAVGVEAVEPGTSGGRETADLAAAFRASDASSACLCSSDGVYEHEAEPAARALREAGCRHLFLAGRPPNAAALEAAGVSGFLHAGSNLPEALGRLLEEGATVGQG